MLSRRHIITGLGVTALAPMPAVAKPFYTSWRNNRAIGGYDAVSYFDGKAERGRSRYIHEWNGVLWRFSSEYHRDRFADAPEKFAPQYGGYGAWAVANGRLAPGDPRIWTIVNGKLYFNFNSRIKRLWLTRQLDFIAQADVRWPELSA